MKTSDLSTRILAVVLAVFLWISVRMVAYTPEVHKTIPLTSGDSASVEYRYSLPPTVDVVLRGPSELLNNLPSLTATVDVSKVTSRTQVGVHIIGLPNGVMAKTPRVDVIPYKQETKEVPISIVFLPALPLHTGVGSYSIDPSTVTVEGSTTDLDTVKYVAVFINPTNPQIGFQMDYTPQAIGVNGDTIKTVQILTRSVSVRVMLQQQK